MTMGNRAAGVVVFLCVCLAASAQGAPGVPAPEVLAAMETAEARQALRESVLEAEIGRLPGLRVAPFFQRVYGTTVAVSVRTRSGAVDVVMRVVQQGGGRGTFTLTRSTSSGRATELRIQTRDDPGSYLLARPLGGRSTLDVFHLDGAAPLYRGVILPVSFDDLIVSPLERIVGLTSQKVDWAFLLHGGWGLADRKVEALAEEIRSRLGGLRDEDDGAISEDGRYVYIADLRPQRGPGGLNCSGFVKWVADGFYYPIVGRNTSVAEAKKRPEDRRNNSYSRAYDDRDPYFGLDWTRNLAALLDAARGGRGGSPTTYDVRDVERMVYTVDLGFPVEDLPLLLYTLAVRDPGMFYLASIAGVLDEDTSLQQHYHTLVILPYIDRTGRLVVSVFERVVESSLASVVRRYAGLRIHLVRVAADGIFRPLDMGDGVENTRFPG